MGIRLLVKTSDPRTGDVERRMTNLNRTEPDPSLFHVPTDYTIKGQVPHAVHKGVRGFGPLTETGCKRGR